MIEGEDGNNNIYNNKNDNVDSHYIGIVIVY